MRRYVPVLSLLGSLILLPACASKPEPVDRRAPAISTPTAALPAPQEAGHQTNSVSRGERLELIRLAHTSAEDVAGVITDLITDARGRTLPGRPLAIADRQTNSVIVFGNDDQRASIKELVVKLDTPAAAD